MPIDRRSLHPFGPDDPCTRDHERRLPLSMALIGEPATRHAFVLLESLYGTCRRRACSTGGYRAEVIRRTRAGDPALSASA